MFYFLKGKLFITVGFANWGWNMLRPIGWRSIGESLRFSYKEYILYIIMSFRKGKRRDFDRKKNLFKIICHVPGVMNTV